MYDAKSLVQGSGKLAQRKERPHSILLGFGCPGMPRQRAWSNGGGEDLWEELSQSLRRRSSPRKEGAAVPELRTRSLRQSGVILRVALHLRLSPSLPLPTPGACPEPGEVTMGRLCFTA